MEDNKETVEAVTTETEQVETTANGKTFTQTEFDEALRKAIARKTKDMPSKEELDKFKEWQDQQKSESDKLVEKEKEHLKVISERDSYKYENIALKAGIKEEDLDYVIFKVLKSEGEFEDNLKEFLQANPKFVAQEEVQTKSTGTIARNQTQETESGVKAILKARYPNIF